MPLIFKLQPLIFNPQSESHHTYIDNPAEDEISRLIYDLLADYPKQIFCHLMLYVLALLFHL